LIEAGKEEQRDVVGKQSQIEILKAEAHAPAIEKGEVM